MVATETDITTIILGMERAALERWGQGDPDGFLEITAEDVSYFDPFAERRIDGIDGLRALYDQFRGTIKIDRFEIIEPRVQAAGDIAVLTFRFDSHGSEGSMRWNTTEVFRKTSSGWKLIHTHWAFHLPQIAAS